ncbi:MAG: hypothetical protein IKH16_05995 [Selenomonadaceae bacterium]|nr:hypothetical protein [Selenomonadaceae bacterium]
MAEENVQDTALEVLDAETVDEGNVIRLCKPMNGKKEIVLDFDKVNGLTLLSCEKNARKIDGNIVIPQFSTVYKAQVAAAAAGMRYDDIIRLSGPDFTAVTNRVAAFLSGAE